MPTSEEVIAAYDALIARALDVVQDAPFWAFVPGGKAATARLSLSGKTATLRWAEAESHHDSCMLEARRCRFPAHLLSMPAAPFADWKKAEQEKYQREWKERAEANAKAVEERERAMLAALKAKYET